MKKLLTFCLCAGMLTAALPAVSVNPLPASAIQTDGTLYASAIEQIDSWDGAYPKWFCGYWTETGEFDHLCIGVTADGEQDAEEFRSRIADPDSVTFVTQQYNLAALETIQEEISMKLKTGDYPNIYGCGIDMCENYVSVYGDFADPSPETAKFAAFCSEAYGDAFHAETSGEIILTAEGSPDDQTGGVFAGGTADDLPEAPAEYGSEDDFDDDIPRVPIGMDGTLIASPEQIYEAGDDAEDGNSVADAGGTVAVYTPPLTPGLDGTPAPDNTFLRILIVATALLLLGIPAVILVRRRQRAAQTNAGTVTVSDGDARTEALLRQHTETPPDDLRARIMEQIKHEDTK